MHAPHRPLLVGTALVALALLASGVASGQVITKPKQGDFETTYFVTGRVVDKDGWPVNQARLTVSITGLKDVRVKDLTAGTDCKGDFEAYFDIRNLEGRDARVKVTMERPSEDLEGFKLVTEEQKVDVVFRRNDLVLKLPYSWPSACQDQANARGYWDTLVSVRGRVVHGSGEHDRNGTTVYADPVQYWPVGLNITLPDGSRWPPDSAIPTDSWGDFKYSWTFRENLTAGVVEAAAKGKHLNFTFDPESRVIYVKLNTGVTPEIRTPGPGGVAALAALAAAVGLLAFRGRREG